VWETSSGRLRESLPLGDGTFADVRFSADGRQLFATVDDGLMAFDLDGSDRFIRRTAPPDAVQYPEGWTGRSVSPLGDTVAVAVYDPEIQAENVHLLDLQTHDRVSLGADIEVQTWRPDGAQVAVTDANGVRVLESASGDTVEQRRFKGGAGALTYSDDGARMLAEIGGGVAMLDAKTLRPLTEPVLLGGDSLSLEGFGPTEGSAVLTTADEPRAPFDFTLTQGWAVVDLDSGAVARKGSLSIPPHSTATSPDGERLAVAGAGQVEIVDLASGGSRISGDVGVETESEGEHIAYSPDGSRLVSADSTGRVSLWDGRTAELLGTVAPSSEMSTPVFLADNRTVLIPAWDGAVYEWDTSLEHATDFACDVVGHGFTSSQWEELLPNHTFEDTCPAVGAR
jgi:WD40 repeat protein